jgi:hypothetical protein
VADHVNRFARLISERGNRLGRAAGEERGCIVRRTRVRHCSGTLKQHEIVSHRSHGRKKYLSRISVDTPCKIAQSGGYDPVWRVWSRGNQRQFRAGRYRRNDYHYANYCVTVIVRVEAWLIPPVPPVEAITVTTLLPGGVPRVLGLPLLLLPHEVRAAANTRRAKKP